MKRRTVLLALGLALPLLGGCTTSAERRTSDDATCRSYGFRPGTDAFAGCLQNIDLDRSAERRQSLYPSVYSGYGAGIRFGRGFY